MIPAPLTPEQSKLLLKRGRNMGRDRFQNGRVELTGTTVKKWTGNYFEYKTDAGVETRHHRTEVLGLKSEMRKHEAETKLRGIISQRLGSVKRLDGSVTFEWFYREKYLPLQKGHWKPSTLYKAESLFNAAILPTFGALPLQSIDKVSIYAHLAKLAETRSKSHVTHVRKYVKAVFEEAIEQDLLVKNPAAKMRLPTCTKVKASRYLTVGEIQKLLAEMKEQHRLMTEVTIYGGLRANELFALRVNDLLAEGLRIDEGVWEGQFGEPKTEGSVACVSLPATVQGRLLVYSRSLKNSSPDALLFPGRNGKAWRANNFLNRVLKPAAKEAGLDGVTIQSLRRTTATHFAQRAAISDTKSQMRHSTASVTFDYYAQSVPASRGLAVESFASEVEGAKNVLNVSERAYTSPTPQVVVNKAGA